MAATFCVDRGHEGPCYWLAHEESGHIILDDGCHSSPDQVAVAAKLHHRIFGADADWFVVKVEPIPPWGDAPIDEKAAHDCAQMLSGDETHPQD